VPQLSKAMSNNSWGGLDAGDQMLYPVQVVDGIVHQLGGKKLASECEKIRALREHDTNGRPIPIPFGTAVSTSGGNENLKREYDHIIHVTPPFFNREYNNNNNNNNNNNGIESDEDPVELLRRCYVEAISLAFDNLTLTSDHRTRNCYKHNIMASPLIGAGARGFPLHIALEVAASQTCLWMDTIAHHRCLDGNNNNNDDDDPSIATNTVNTIAFGIPNSTSAEILVNMIAEQTKIEEC